MVPNLRMGTSQRKQNCMSANFLVLHKEFSRRREGCKLFGQFSKHIVVVIKFTSNSFVSSSCLSLDGTQLAHGIPKGSGTSLRTASRGHASKKHMRL